MLGTRTCIYLASGLLFAAGIAALPVCAQDRGLTVIKVGKIEPFTRDDGSPDWAIEIGRAKGFFQQEGMDVQFVLTDGFGGQMRGLLEGRFEIGHQAAVQTIAEIEKKAPIFLFMADRRSPSLVLVADRSVASIGDLRGKSVATSGPGGQDHLPMVKMLSDSGLQPGHYAVLNCGNVAKRYECLTQGKVAATLLNPDQAGQAREGGWTILGSAERYVRELPLSAAAARRDWAAGHRELLTAYIRAYLRSVTWLLDSSHEQEGISLVATRTGADHETAARLYHNALQRLISDLSLTTEGVSRLLEAMMQAGLLPQESRQAGDYVDVTFLEAARERR